MKEYKVSVIVPVYNCEKFIKKCVISILKQSYKNIEILLVNDGSTDNSYLKCQELSEEDNRIIVYSKENGGVSSARNYGLKKSKGEYILFVDGDDYLEVDCIEKCMKIINENNLDIIKFGIIKEISRNINKKNTFSIPTNRIILNEEYKEVLYPYTFLTNDFCNITNAIIRKNIINHEFEQRLIGEDFLFFIECLINSKNIYFINDSFYHYVVNEESATHIFNNKKHLQKLIDNTYVNNKIREILDMKDVLAESYINKLCNDIYSNITIFIISNNYQDYCKYIDEINNENYLKCEFQKVNNKFPININKILSKNKFIYYKIKTKETIKTTIKKIIIKLFRKA